MRDTSWAARLSVPLSPNTNSAPKRLRDARVFKKIANACLSFVMIGSNGTHPQYIPFLRDGRPIEVGKFGDERDELSGIYLVQRYLFSRPLSIGRPIAKR